jgi:hypothetical protein
MYASTTLFTMLHSYIFPPSRAHPQGVLIHLVSMISKIPSQSSKLSVSDSCHRTLLFNLISTSGHLCC